MRTRQELAVEWVPIESVQPYNRNPRRHTTIRNVASSISEFGFRQPIVVDARRVVIAGHVRLLAAQQLRLSEVPIHVAESLSDAQVQAYRLMDNRSHEDSNWDRALLALEMSDLKVQGFDLSLTGFTSPELAALLASVSNADPEFVPDTPVEPVTRLGDLWLLGSHRLLCGDATSASDVGRLLGERKPHLMVTDPPYGMEYEADWRNHAIRGSGQPIGGRAVGKVANDDRSDWSAVWALFPGDVAYVWHADRKSHLVAAGLESAGFELRAQIIWAKSQFVISRGHYHSQHEPCWYAVRRSGVGHWFGNHSQSTLWQIDKPRKSETGHSTQKPVECMKRPIENNSEPGDTLFEPFCGSGTTIVAAHLTARTCLALEIEPTYVDTSVLRWEALSCSQAVLESDGRTFAELRNERTATAA